MYKKIATALCLWALITFIPASAVLAKPKATIQLLDIEYTNFRPAPERFVSEKGGLSFLADGLGTIDCNGVTACVEAGLDGGTVRVQQILYWDADRGNLTEALTARTAGTLQLGDYPARKFTGKGESATVCTGDLCTTSLGLDANLEGGGKLIFARLDIDHSSAGIIDMDGEGELMLGGRGAS